MAAGILDGKKLAKQLRRRIKDEVARLLAQGLVPGLAVIIVGKDPASRRYVDAKKRMCKRLGILSEEYQLSEDATEQTLLRLVDKINRDDRIHGLIIQRPLPAQIDADRVIEAVDPAKDVDCFHPLNTGRLLSGDALIYPCTPRGVVALLEEAGFGFEGAHAVVIGRSTIVGKPLALMLLEKNCTVSVCHSKTLELPKMVGRADLLVAAVGRAGLVRGDWIKEGAWVVDVGTNLTEDGRLVGDVDFESALERAAFITPVPGGVGPMTTAMLMENTLLLARRSFEGATGLTLNADEEEN